MTGRQVRPAVDTVQRTNLPSELPILMSGNAGGLPLASNSPLGSTTPAITIPRDSSRNSLILRQTSHAGVPFSDLPQRQLPTSETTAAWLWRMAVFLGINESSRREFNLEPATRGRGACAGSWEFTDATSRLGGESHQ